MTSMDDEEGPVTKAAAAVALAELELQEAAREEAKMQLQRDAVLVGETALALARITSPENQRRDSAGSRGDLRGSESNLMLSPEQLVQLQRGKLDSPGVTASPSGNKMSVAARARLDADMPSRPIHLRDANAYDPPKPSSSHNDAGISRGKFSPQQVKQMMDAWGNDDTSDDESSCGLSEQSDDWNDEYLRPTRSVDAISPSKSSEKSEKKYIKSLEKGQHHLRYTRSTSPDATPDRPDKETFQYQHHRVSNYNNRMKRNERSSDSLKSNSSSSAGAERAGLFESAKNWLSVQREKLHRLELERQVEDQRRKLVEEGRRRRLEEAEAKRRWENRPAARELAREMQQQQLPIEQQDSGRRSQNDLVRSASHESNAAVHKIAGFCGMTFDDADDDETMGRVNSSGQLEESSDCDEYLKVGSPRNTVSGKGMCVKVDLPHEEAEQLHRVDHHSPDSKQQQRDEQNQPQQQFARESFVIDHVKVVEEPQTEIPPILTHDQMKSLVLSGALPPSLDYCKWERIYNLTRDGDSFDTFLRNVEGRDRTVLVVKTTLGKIFGGYADTRWESKGMHRHAHEFYGTGQSCLFQYTSQNVVRVYKWSGANRYIQLCDGTKRTIAFGGGGDEGVFGLCIEDDFRRGTTGHCETFQNEPLCEEGYFDVVDLEVWGFRLDF